MDNLTRTSLEQGDPMDIEQRLEAIEKKLHKAQLVAGAALGLAMVLGVLALVQLASN